METLLDHLKTFLMLAIWIVMVTVSCNACLYGVTGGFLLQPIDTSQASD